MDPGVIGRLIEGIEDWTKSKVAETETGDEKRRGKGLTEGVVALKAKTEGVMALKAKL